MGKIVIAVFLPKPGKEGELLDLIQKRLPLLRRLGLATDRPNVTMRSSNGTILDVSEWSDCEAIERAHSHPAVLEMWDAFEDCCEYKQLDSIEEINSPFATFDAI